MTIEDRINELAQNAYELGVVIPEIELNSQDFLDLTKTGMGIYTQGYQSNFNVLFWETDFGRIRIQRGDHFRTQTRLPLNDKIDNQQTQSLKNLLEQTKKGTT